ncbi:hypothetical protein QFZ28_000708 [Neobacillus niacini]|uniref:hypothetical protein n=1 Tax=Neobacillus niacini TaxID=86668 RepID=UPI0027869A92|nr:hypothetical protein [Neobacillus niacini]MDQ1000308.1 hypothetical protein [Neobacillus niacini]
MILFSKLIQKIKVNEEDLILNSFTNIERKNAFTSIEYENGGKYEFETEANSYIQLFLQAEENYKFFCRKDVIEYFLNEKKVAEFQVESKDLESIHLLGEKAENVLINLFGNKINCIINSEIDEEKFRLKTLFYPGSHERVWNSHRDIRYHYIEAKENLLNNQLIVIFAGMGRMFEYKYNYSKAISEINCHKLFIIDDYGARGSYYLGNNGDSLVETSVISLILNIASSNNVPLNNILAMGSSKGGFAALYYGIKYSFGKIVAAAPQTLLGNFLQNFTLDMVEDITNNREKADISFLNQKLFRLLEGKRIYPDIHLLVGSEDNHHQNHLRPLINKLQQAQVEYKYEVIEGYGHNALALFQNYFTQKANYLVLNKDPLMYVKSVELKLEADNQLICEVNCDQADKVDFAYYWYRDKECIEKQFYSKGRAQSLMTTGKVKGSYSAIVFVKLNNSIIKLISDSIQLK